MAKRRVQRVVQAVSTVDGAGARIRRSIGAPRLGYLDPFLLLDEFFVEPPAGFPMHGHSGFEIVTYMLEGAFVHQDSTGGRGRIDAGGVQHICAGEGVQHSEEPGTDGLNYGLQLWVNLPRDSKKVPASWQDVRPPDLPVETRDGSRVRTIVGPGSPVELEVPVTYLDIAMDRGARFDQVLPSDHNAFIYVLDGEVTVGADDQARSQSELLVLGDGDEVAVEACTDARFVLIAGKPLQRQNLQPA